MIDKLIEKSKKLRAPVCVGLDPTVDLLPDHIISANGGNVPAAFLEFNINIIDAVYDIVPAVKPQIAFYEQYGAEGFEVYTKTVAYAKSRGLIVIADVKRGDIGSTATAYAEGRLAADGADFATVNPYLGKDSLKPFIDVCKRDNKGIFVLVATSNPGGADLQKLELVNGLKLYEHVGNMVSEIGGDLMGNYGYSSVCAVVGATKPEEAINLRRQLPSVFFLIPGYGAQGGTAADVAVCFDAQGAGGIVNSSRGIIGAWKKTDKPEDYAQAARAAAVAMVKDLREYIGGL
ncbi:MAG: orotidine-5'-phosphate decarboxylase [Defluviitaleaceae bacterium]|nr:orotidine-5'-phosphate decarboxylase [Defluviitaleaceae bacterium]